MKTLKYIFAGLVLAAGLSSCIGDLDVTPIDPSKNTADKALKTADDYYSLLAQCYTGFAVSGSYGPNGDNNISGVDGGFSQYYRGRYHLNGLTTDEAVCGWNDQTRH
ncbi:MAG: RagB/SusD family nutrient uptake outer membrane protein, partial [Bacteroidales bacterium]|nr:RagB/SusD family nutrient uptake outer membrane protein [Bacteroidales bacterium]